MKYFHESEISFLEGCQNNRFIVHFGKEGCSLMNKIGEISDQRFRKITPRNDGYFVVEKEFLVDTLIDENCRIICDDCQDISEFSDDQIALVVKRDGQKRWITKEGFEFGEQFKDIGYFSGGFGPVALDNGKWSYIDKNMNVANVSFDLATSFFENDHAIVVNDDKFYIINKKFEIVSGPYHDVYFIDGDMVLVKHQDKSFAYYSVDGKKISKDYKMCFGFDGDISMVESEQGVGYINRQGEEICEPKYKNVQHFGDKLGVIGCFDKNGEHTFAFVKKDGSISQRWYPVADVDHEGKASAMIGRKFYYLDENLNPISKGYKRVGMFSNGVGTCEKPNGKSCYLDENFEEFGGEHDSVKTFGDGFGVVRNNGQYDAVSRAGLKLSKISEMAKKIELTPIKVLTLPEEFSNDKETLLNLCNHALEIIDFALDSDAYDDISKSQFLGDKKLIEVLKMKTQSAILQNQKTAKIYN